MQTLDDIWAGFQLLGRLVIAVAAIVLFVVLAIAAPPLAIALGLVLGVAGLSRALGSQRDRSDKGLLGLAKLIAEFDRLAGSGPNPASKATSWTPASILRRASMITETEALALIRAYRRAETENDALEERHPSPGLALVRAAKHMARQSDELYPVLSKIGNLVSGPIFHNLVWLPAERRYRNTGNRMALAPRADDDRYMDAQFATEAAVQAIVLARWLELQDFDWLMRPWRDVFGDQLSAGGAGRA